MKAHNKNDGMKTEVQWNKLNYKLKEGAKGIELWTNRYCGQIATYYNENEVEKMTEEDTQKYKQQQREINKIRRREYEERKEYKFIEIGEDIGFEKGKKSQFLEDLKTFGYKIVMVNIDEKGAILHYVVPNNIDIGYTGKFPYGKETVTGIVTDEEIDIQKLKKESWFPDKIRLVIIE